MIVEVGALYALTEDGEVDSGVPSMPILEGVNVFGRADCTLFTKQVSRKHISITAASSVHVGVADNGGVLVKIAVEGPNPVVLVSGNERRKLTPRSESQQLVDGDVIEFVPQGLPFKYISKPIASSPPGKETWAVNPPGLLSNRDGEREGSKEVLVSNAAAVLMEDRDNDELSRKRVNQIEEDEALARLLQEEEERAGAASRDGNGVSSTSALDQDLHSNSSSQNGLGVDTKGALGPLVIKDDESIRKRKSQIDEDQELAQLLQEEEDRVAAGDGSGGLSGPSNSRLDGSGGAAPFMHSSSSRVDPNADLKRPKTKSEGPPKGAPTFFLMHTQALPRWANAGCIQIQDVVQGDIQVAVLSNYMVDVSWLLSACPSLRRISQVIVIHGEGGQSLELLERSKPKNWHLFKPPLPIAYGTHHSKAMLLVYATGVRIVVHTANLIYVDWNNKTQGLWMQDFPFKNDTGVGQVGSSVFEQDLVEYLEALHWPGLTAVLPNLGETRINASFFRKFDYSSANVRLVASVPGYHQGRSRTKWGHMKLRTVLQEQSFDEQFQGSNLVFQFSSLGSLDEKWISELTASMSAGSTQGSKKQLGPPGRVQMVWPTVEDIRSSLEGYAAGNAVPSPEKNVKKEFLIKYWARWKADHKGRARAMPHIKSYVRYNGQSVAWFLLTSSNLSKAAWGALQKNGTQIMIRSYELGVCFLPSLLSSRPSSKPFSCTECPPLSLAIGNQVKFPTPGVRDDDDVEASSQHGRLVTSCTVKEDGENPAEQGIFELPVPYSLPPPPYAPGDVPWSWDRFYREPDVYGETWPRSVKLYSYQGE